jgi:tartrate-resistant acid phosphatase type 5
MHQRFVASVFSIFLLGFAVWGQTPATATQQNFAPYLEKFSPEVREKAQALLTETEELKRIRLATELARLPMVTSDFLLALLNSEASAKVRYAIVDNLGRGNTPRIIEMLERFAVNDADVSVSRIALERLRQLRHIEMRNLLTKRLAAAREKNDEAGLRELAQEQERWISLMRGTMLPAFLRKTPEKFSLKAEDKAIRVLAFGDFGTGSASQKKTAAAMLEFHRKTPFDFGITLGDNFYNIGMLSPADPRWKTWWEDMYAPLGVKFYATLGNHDWGHADSPAAEILYSEKSSTWKMPAPYYTFTAGSVQFFALDTNDVSEAQLMWLKEEIEKSKARWKIVYGHHPIYSDGDHGDSVGLKARLLPLLKDKVDMYLVGHDHVVNHIKSENGIHFFVSGGAGAGLYKVAPKERTLFAQSINAFSVIDADASEMKFRFIDADNKPLYEYTIRKANPSPTPRPNQ